MKLASSHHTASGIAFLCVCSAVFCTLRSHGLQPVVLLCPWNFLGKNTGVGCHFLLHFFSLFFNKFPSQNNTGLSFNDVTVYFPNKIIHVYFHKCFNFFTQNIKSLQKTCLLQSSKIYAPYTFQITFSTNYNHEEH